MTPGTLPAWHRCLNRAAYGYSEPTDEVQRPWADAYLADWSQPRAPRAGLSRFVFPARELAGRPGETGVRSGE